MMHILDISVVWLLTRVYVIGTRLLNDVDLISLCISMLLHMLFRLDKYY